MFSRLLMLKMLLSVNRVKELIAIKNPGPKPLQCFKHIQALTSARSQAEVDALAPWDSICSGNALTGEVSDTVERMAGSVADLRELRQSLNVGIDDFLAEKYRDKGCPKP